MRSCRRTCLAAMGTQRFQDRHYYPAGNRSGGSCCFTGHWRIFRCKKTKPCAAGTVQTNHQRGSATIRLSDRYYCYETRSAYRSAQHPKNACTGCNFHICSVQRSRRVIHRISPTACKKTFAHRAGNRGGGRHKPDGSGDAPRDLISNRSF